MAIFNSYVKLPEGNVSFQPPQKTSKTKPAIWRKQAAL